MNRVVLVLSLSAGLLACRADRNGSVDTPRRDSLSPAPRATSTEATTMNLGNPALPGIESAAVSAELSAALSRALAARGDDYRPRTHHLRPDGSPVFTNRLIRETSPYLLQHAHNPVNWYPWGEEALARAQAEDKPIFLSIGYSTCHWCHVMERESFEDEEIAAFINAHFIPIKVDREERPDLDDLYMRAVHMMVRRGGWPMTTMLTPDREPFFAGTYFPPRDGVRGARRGLLSILQEMARRFREERATVVAEAQRISQRLQQAAAPRPPGDVPPDTAIGIAARQLARGYDAQLGGFGRAPKFPQPSRLLMMTRYAHRARDESAMRMVTHTLDQMAHGGIYDQVGGGFHRYSTDAQWLVPHFEKMLYDNAQLVDAYLEAYQATGERRFADTARHVLDYVAREMTNAGGGFYSATDADSPVGDDPSGHQEEGWFFTWTPAELRAVLGVERSRVVEARYGVSARGNFEGRNILHVVLSEAEVAQRLGMPVGQVRDHLSSSLQALYDARATRPPPLRDDKVLTAWNGLMIHAFARAGWILDDDGYRETSRRAADYLWNHLRRGDGRLMRSQLGDAEPRHLAYLIDYAAYIEGLLSVFEATGEPQMLQRARTLATLLESHHADEDGGGYYQTADDAETLLTRDKPDADNVIPSGASIAAMNLLRLAAFTGDDVYRTTAERLFASVSSAMQRYPSGFPRMLCALDAYHDRFLEVAIVAPSATADTGPLLDVIRRAYSPARVVVQTTDDAAGALSGELPWLQGKRAQGGRVTAYVCERGRCELPTSDPEVLRRQLAARPYEPAPAPISP